MKRIYVNAIFFAGMILCVAIPLQGQTIEPAVVDSLGNQVQIVQDAAYSLRIPVLAQRPPLRTDMPLDVLLGYIYADSLARNSTMPIVASIAYALKDSDTMRYAMRYFYRMHDYDPVRFFQWLGVNNSEYATEPGWALGKIMNVIGTQIPTEDNKTLKWALLQASYVAHIRVTEEYFKTSATAKRTKSIVLITAELLDPIKGQILPYCVNSDGSEPDEQKPITQPAIPGACLQFEYRLEWTRLNHSDVAFGTDSTFGSFTDDRWLQPGNEYIVFLGFRRPYGFPSDFNYAYLTPGDFVSLTTTGAMFPVVNNIVQNPHGDFGLPNGLSTEEFKDLLRTAIDTIISYNE